MIVRDKADGVTIIGSAHENKPTGHLSGRYRKRVTVKFWAEGFEQESVLAHGMLESIRGRFILSAEGLCEEIAECSFCTVLRDKLRECERRAAENAKAIQI